MREITKIEEILLLAIWRLKKDAYGVKIRKHVAEVTEKDFSYGHLYDALAQLEKKGLVVRELGDVVPNKRGRRKKIYTVTRFGFEALERAREVNNLIWNDVPAFLIGSEN